MKFAVGYQLSHEDEEHFTDIVMSYRDEIEEVYFSWVNMASGRASINSQRGFVDWQAQQQLEEDLRIIKKAGIKLDLLFNANCFGKYAVSEYLHNNVCSIIEYIGEVIGGPDIITTTSPAIAHVVKQNFKEIEVRASVNMRIGTVKGMQYVSHLFDTFYVQREFNRDFEKIKELKEWADDNGKKLHMLTNSGCMNYCSGQTFHDNLVAHEEEIDEIQRIDGWNPHVCWNYYKNRDNWVSFLQNSWVRPEDLHHYDEFFSIAKLATRMHAFPGLVIQAYKQKKFYGNLLDLFEPGFGSIFAPYVIDNARFPSDWFQQTSKCNKQCHRCGYCQSVLEKVLIKMQE